MPSSTAATICDVPWSWYYACPLAELARGPHRVEVGRRQYVLFLTQSGHVRALDARCVHLGADLSLGCVAGESIRCPFHEWEFDGTSGRCVRIPATDVVPDFARQNAYPTAIRGGHVFFFNRSQALFDAPFYDGLSPDDLLPAMPFDLTLDFPWYMVAANGFDLQHFRTAHDRTLLAEPTVQSRSSFARSITGTFAVTGTSWMDALTRRFSGPQVTMTVESWCGTMVLVTARFRRTTSYGMVCIAPVDASHCRLRCIVWVPRSRGAVGRALFDPADAAVRRLFIKAFVLADKERSAGIRYNPGSLIDADAVLAAYFQWLADTARGEAIGMQGS